MFETLVIYSREFKIFLPWRRYVIFCIVLFLLSLLAGLYGKALSFYLLSHFALSLSISISLSYFLSCLESDCTWVNRCLWVCILVHVISVWLAVTQERTQQHTRTHTHTHRCLLDMDILRLVIKCSICLLDGFFICPETTPAAGL